MVSDQHNELASPAMGSLDNTTPLTTIPSPKQDSMWRLLSQLPKGERQACSLPLGQAASVEGVGYMPHKVDLLHGALQALVQDPGRLLMPAAADFAPLSIL